MFSPCARNRLNMYCWLNHSYFNLCCTNYVYRLTTFQNIYVCHNSVFQIGMSHIQTVRMYPFMLHTISMSLFASIIGPFGGFFASGFKRAFNIKVNLKLFFVAKYLQNRN